MGRGGCGGGGRRWGRDGGVRVAGRRDVQAALGQEVGQGGIVLGLDGDSLEQLPEHLILLLGLGETGFVLTHRKGEGGHLDFAGDFEENEGHDDQGEEDEKPIFSCAHDEEGFRLRGRRGKGKDGWGRCHLRTKN